MRPPGFATYGLAPLSPRQLRHWWHTVDGHFNAVVSMLMHYLL